MRGETDQAPAASQYLECIGNATSQNCFTVAWMWFFRLVPATHIRHKGRHQLTMRTPLVSALVAVLLFPQVADGSIGNIPLLHVETYGSPSAKWKLEVDPTDRDGGGKGNYRMVCDGKEVWQGGHPFTLRNAKVTDEGVTVGYGYSEGLRGTGFLNVVIMDAAGKVRMNDEVKRTSSRIPDASPNPSAAGLILHAQQDRFIMRLGKLESDGWRETWRVYQLSTGRKLSTIDLHAASKVTEAERYLLDAKPITGLPLVLVQWWRCDASEVVGTTFSILDFKGRRLWSLELPKDYTIPDDEAAEERLRDEIREDGAILETKENGEFEIRQVAAGERVRFKVARDPKAENAWAVKEISRAKYQPPSEAKPVPAPAPPPLKFINSFVLGDPPATGAIRDIIEFDIDAEGRFGFLRRAKSSDGYSFCIVDRQGKLITETALPRTKDTNTHCAWLGASRWIITASGYGEDRMTRAWWFDVEKKALAEVIGFDCPSVEVIKGSGDGGFVTLATFHQRYSSADFLIRFDSHGKALWKRKEVGDDDPASLLSPEDVTVTSGREIAVLDNIRKTVQLFNFENVYLRTINLKKSWKREPNYPSGITHDADGGFIVQDFDGKPPFVRMKANGSVRGDFIPKHADGRVIKADRGVRAAPDGSLWVCDGEAFMQLSDQGNAIHLIGSAPDADKLGDIIGVTVDALGKTYAVDRRTGSVHVFDPDGKKIRVCKPDKGDFPKAMWMPHIAVAADGSVMLEKEDFTRRAEYLCFGPNGERLGFKSHSLDTSSEEWYPQPGTSNMLVSGYGVAFLINAEGKVLKKIERQADRRWFDHLSGVAFADDGSFVIHSFASDSSENTITFFSSDGVAQSTCIPEGEGFTSLGGYNGRLFSMAGDKGVQVYDRSGKVLGRTPGTTGYDDHFITRSGKELWRVDRTTRKVERFELP